MVTLDDEHSKKHVLKEMEIYGKLVSLGSYMSIEDTSMRGHLVWPQLGRPYGGSTRIHERT